MPEIRVTNPATLEELSAIPVPTNSEIDSIVENSRIAFLEWKKTPFPKRQQMLGQISDALASRKEELARLLTQEQGKPLHESLREIDAIASVFKLYSTFSVEGEILVEDESTDISVEKEPYGVCALILPWNYPVGLLGWKLAPCLLGGNSAVVKPSSFVPLAVMECISIMKESLPQNIVQAVPGGADSGAYLSRHGGIDRISFTGSQETGRKIMGYAAGNFPKLTLELGGNDAAIILNDCNLEKRFGSIFSGCFFNAGQICIAIKRIYVHASLQQDLIKKFVEKANALKVGNGLEPGTQMGPLNNEAQLKKVEDLVEDARANGATIAAGGSRLPGEGNFYSPTVITGLDDTFRIVKEEQFGPAIPILTFSDIDDAIARANDTPYGLGGSVWTEDIEKGRELASRLECGTAWVNAHMLLEHKAPFGGWKHSGNGRELGQQGLEEFLQTRTLYVRK